MQKSKLQIRIKNFYFFATIFLLVLFSVNQVYAAEVFFGTHSRQSDEKKQFEVGVFLNTKGETINAVEGVIIFPQKRLELVDVRDGNSLINFWLEKPRLDYVSRNGSVSFSGIIPGGYSGNRGILFSLLFTPEALGEAEITATKVKVFLHSKEALETSVSIAPIQVEIVSNPDILGFIAKKDYTLPETFTIEIARSDEIFSGKWFAVFTSQDKESGISHYEVAESKSKNRKREWKTIESPYVLTDQALTSYIHVKAVDKSGNESFAVYPPRYQQSWYKNKLLFGIIIILMGIFFVIKKVR